MHGLRRPGARHGVDRRVRSSPRTARLHELGWAHSVETWRDGELVGGLYGLRVGGLFAGESMFHRVTRCVEGGVLGDRRAPADRRRDALRRAMDDAAPANRSARSTSPRRVPAPVGGRSGAVAR